MNPASPHRHRITLLIFVSGAVLLALEIAGSRVLAPFFGSSVFVWGSLIGIFLGAISGGYWLGGWLSELWPVPGAVERPAGRSGRLPFHFMTREFLEEVKAHLTPNGVVLTNITSAFTGKNGRIFRWEYLTYRDVFPALYVFPCTREQETDRDTARWWARRRNIFLAATLEHEQRPKAFLLERAENYWGRLGRAPHTRRDTELYRLFRHASDLVEAAVIDQWIDTGHRAGAPVDFSDAQVLTDDYAPVDTMNFEQVLNTVND